MVSSTSLHPFAHLGKLKLCSNSSLRGQSREGIVAVCEVKGGNIYKIGIFSSGIFKALTYFNAMYVFNSKLT